MQIREGFRVTYGRDLTTQVSESCGNALIVTMEEVWPLVEDAFGRGDKKVHFVKTLEVRALDELVRGLGSIDAVVGIGGGSSADVAKYVSWKLSLPLYQIPSIISVNACFTHMVAVRDDGRVRYVGDAVPEMVYVDYSLIQKAPPRLNRAGLGDILSCHTGLFDWALADRAGREPRWNEALAARTRELLAAVRSNAREVRAVSEAGIHTIMEVHKWVGAMCHEHGHPRFEEGSEHHFAYNLEFVTGKHVLHGELVCLGIFLMSSLQGNDPKGVLDTIDQAGVEIRPEMLGISWDEMRKTLLTLRDYVVAERLPYTIIHEKPIDEAFVQDMRGQLARG